MKKKNVIIAVVGIVVVFLIAVIAVYHDAAHMVFNNLTAYKIDLDETSEWNGGKSYLKVPYALDSDSQYLDLYVPNTATNEDKPMLFVLVHGGGFISNDSQSRQAQLMYRYFRDNGFACASVNYRLAQEEPFPGALSDVKAAVRFLKAHADEYGFNADKVAIWGESAGGYLAVAAAVTGDDEFCDVEYIGQKEIEEKRGEKVSASVDACVDYYGAVDLSIKDNDWKSLKVPGFIIDIANSWLHTDILAGYSDVESFWLRKETTELSDDEKAYSSIDHYISENISSENNIKFWISHGDCDITVPILQSELLYDKLCGLLGESNVTYRIVKNAGHAGDIMYTDEELSMIREFLIGI
jgi:acetyl esterase/lipase